MFQICQKDTNGLAGGGIRIHGKRRTTTGRMGVLCARERQESRASQLMGFRKLLQQACRAAVLVLWLDSPLCAEAQPTAHAPPAKWWNNAVIYEIYPRSFQDQTGMALEI
jgi:hypothetical protein